MPEAIEKNAPPEDATARRGGASDGALTPEEPLIKVETPIGSGGRKISPEEIEKSQQLLKRLAEEKEAKQKEQAGGKSEQMELDFEALTDEEIRPIAEEIFQKRLRGEPPYTYDVIDKVLLEKGITPDLNDPESDSARFMRDWDWDEAQRLLRERKAAAAGAPGVPPTAAPNVQAPSAKPTIPQADIAPGGSPFTPEQTAELAQKRAERERGLEEVAFLLELQSQRERFAPIEQEYREELRKRLGTLPENEEARRALTEKVAAELPEELRTRYEEAKAAYGKAKQECVDYRLKAIQEKPPATEEEKNQERGGFLTQFIYEEVGRFQERQELARSEKDQGLLRNWAGSLARGMARLPGPARWAASGVIGGAAVLGVTFGLGITAPVAGLGVAGYLGVRAGRAVLGGVSGYYAGRLTKRLSESYRKEHGLTEEGARQEVGRVMQEQNQELMAGAVERVVALGEEALLARLERTKKAKSWGKGFEVLSAFLAGGLASLGTGYAVEAATLGGRVAGIEPARPRSTAPPQELPHFEPPEPIPAKPLPAEGPEAMPPDYPDKTPFPSEAVPSTRGGAGVAPEVMPPAPEKSELLGALEVKKDQNPLLLAKRIYLAQDRPTLQRLGLPEDFDFENKARLREWAGVATARNMVGQRLVEGYQKGEFAELFKDDAHKQLAETWLQSHDPKTLDQLVGHIKEAEFNDILKNKVPNLVQEGDRIEVNEYGNIRAVSKEGKVLVGHVEERPKAAAAEAAVKKDEVPPGEKPEPRPPFKPEGGEPTLEGFADPYGNNFKRVERVINGRKVLLYEGELRKLPPGLAERAPENVALTATVEDPGGPYKELKVFDIREQARGGRPQLILRTSPEQLGVVENTTAAEVLQRTISASHERLGFIDKFTRMSGWSEKNVLGMVNNLELQARNGWEWSVETEEGEKLEYALRRSREGIILALTNKPSPFSGELFETKVGERVEDLLTLEGKTAFVKHLSDAAEALEKQVKGYQLDRPLEDVLETSWKDVVAQANAWKGLQEGYVPESKTSHGGFMEWLLHQVSDLGKAGKIEVNPNDRLKDVLDGIAGARAGARP